MHTDRRAAYSQAAPVTPLLIEGYASLYGRPDQVRDLIEPGAFARSLAWRAQPDMLLQHQTGSVIGRWREVKEVGTGLYVRGLVEDRTALNLIQNGLDGLSIGFYPLLWHREASGGRTLKEVALVEISLVSAPMHPDARFKPMTPIRPRRAHIM